MCHICAKNFCDSNLNVAGNRNVADNRNNYVSHIIICGG